MAVVSAEREGNPDNATNTAKLHTYLQSSGFAFEPSLGGFVENKGSKDEVARDGEHSFVVIDIKDVGGLKEAMIKQGTKYDQDSILFSAKGDPKGWLIGTTKRTNTDIRYKQKMAIGKPHWGERGEYYTKVKAGYFTFR
jgi:hypothetical protein